jgi:hypothetical protein
MKTSGLSLLAVGVTLAAVTAGSLLLAERAGWHISSWIVLIYAVAAFLTTNILLFSLNLLIALREIRGVEKEEEIEKVMVPALQGETMHLGERIRAAFRCVAVILLGVIVGAAIILVVQRI